MTIQPGEIHVHSALAEVVRRGCGGAAGPCTGVQRVQNQLLDARRVVNCQAVIFPLRFTTWPQGAFTAWRRALLPRQLKVIVNHPPPTLSAIKPPHRNTLADLSFPPK